jgi:hypothetical protein
VSKIRASNTENHSIQRCPHDKQNPYAQISRDLLRDGSISPNCRWMLSYLLSMQDGWKISASQLINHLKSHMGRDKVYAIIKEAIRAGYMYREEIFDKGLKRTRLLVSETPKFLIMYPLPENQYAENQHPENPSSKERTKEKTKEKKTKPTRKSTDLPLGRSVLKSNPLHHHHPLCAKEEMKRKMISYGWSEKEFEEAWNRYLKAGDVRHVQSWLQTTLNSIRLDNEKKRYLESEKEEQRRIQALKQAEMDILMELERQKEEDLRDFREKASEMKSLNEKNRIQSNKDFMKKCPAEFSSKFKIREKGVSLAGGDWDGYTLSFEDENFTKIVSEHLGM